jgi:hypothetical protein
MSRHWMKSGAALQLHRRKHSMLCRVIAYAKTLSTEVSQSKDLSVWKVAQKGGNSNW